MRRGLCRSESGPDRSPRRRLDHPSSSNCAAGDSRPWPGRFMISLRARVCLSIKHLLFRALVILSMSLQTRAAEPTNIFPIMPWNSPPNDLAVLKKIHDCGFTLAGFVAPAGLPLCEQAELQAIVSDARISGYDWASVDA